MMRVFKLILASFIFFPILQLRAGNINAPRIVNEISDLPVAALQHAEKDDELLIFTHGQPGALLLNGKWQTGKGLATSLSKFLSAKTRAIRIFGCSFGKGPKGQEAVAYLQKVLNVTISASDDITGKEGDWKLEAGDPYTLHGLENYAYNLQCGGTVGGINPGDDFDGDGICNEVDIDDDNDGVLDVTEQSLYTCETALPLSQRVSPWTLAPDNTSASSTVNFGGKTLNITATTTKTFSSILDESWTFGSGIYVGCPDAQATITGSAINIFTNAYTVTYTFDKPVKNPTLSFSSFNSSAVNFPQQVYVSGMQGTVSGVSVGDYITSIPATENIVSVLFEGVYNSISFTVPNSDNQGAVILHIQKIEDAGTPTYSSTSGNPFGYEDIDSDEDNFPNRLDLDSDADNCSDAREASATSSTTANYKFSGTDVNSNGLVDAVENGTTGMVNYTSTYHFYAIYDFLNLCLDTDGDGAPDFGYLDADIDDDNDGVPDATEAPGCFYTAAEAGTIASITSALTSPDGTQTDGDIQMLHNGALTTYDFNFDAGQPINGAALFIVTYPTPVVLTSMTLHNITTFGAGTTARLQGSADSVTWVNISASVSLEGTANKVFTATNSNAYVYYRILGDGGSATTVTTTTIAEITAVRSSNYKPSAHPKPTCHIDTDSDGLTNNRDLDSDADGCSDAREAGATTEVTPNYQFSGPDANGNGLADVVENGATGTVNYTSIYNLYAIYKFLNLCLDTDGDGVSDFSYPTSDIDDDNDGALNATEAPGCYYTTAEANTIASITSALTSADDAQTDGDIQMLHNGALTTYDFNFNAGQPINGSALFIVKYLAPVSLASMTLHNITTFGTGTTARLQGSVDSVTWVNASASVSLEGTANKVFTATNSNPYLYYRILGDGGSATTVTTTTIAEISSVLAAGYSPSAHPKNTCSTDTDGDGLTNNRDLDSDSDGCGDAAEAGATSETAANYQFTGTDANGNGLVDAIENGTTGTVNYVSTYNLFAVSNFLNICSDTDGDGVKDFGYSNSDIDDDNDGALNATEAPGCYYTAAEAGTIASITSALTSPDDTQTDGDIQMLHDGALTTYTFNFNAGQPINGSALFIVKYPAPVALASITLHNIITFGASTTARLQGSVDSVTWVDASTSVSLATTANKVFTVTNNNPYVYYRILGDGGSATTVTTTTIAEITSVLAAGYNASAHPKSVCSTDTDGDGLPDNRDLDSDGDNCSDARESGATSSTTTNYQFSGTDANSNGLIDIIENGTTGTVNYTSTYNLYASYRFLSLCSDSDTDGVADLTDIDDDNDGAPDATEAPGCYYTTAEATVPASISTGMASTVNSVAVTAGANIPTMYDGVTTTVTASNHVIAAAGASFVGANIYTIQYKTPINLNSVSVTGSAASWGTSTAATLYGSNDSVTWTSLMSAALNTAVTTAPKTFTVNQNAAQYRYYQIRGTAGTGAAITNYEVTGTLNAASYNPSAHPKSTCTTDTDNDGVTNNRDLDSDGDNCSDAREAGATASNTVNYQFTGSVGANGLDNSLETTPDNGIINYTSTYDYAIESTFNVCADTDGDGIGDLTDIDDDNDGVLDTVEAACSIQAVNKTGITLSAPPNVTYTFNGSHVIADLVDGIDNNIFVMYNPTGTLNNAPLLTVKFSQPQKAHLFRNRPLPESIFVFAQFNL